MDNFDDEDFLTDLEEQIAEEREEKYEKLDQMTDEEYAEYRKQLCSRMREFAKKARLKVATVKPDDKKEGK